eukprot:scaffold177002_cov17-Tisochrysis_lutea.AAC.1
MEARYEQVPAFALHTIPESPVVRFPTPVSRHCPGASRAAMGSGIPLPFSLPLFPRLFLFPSLSLLAASAHRAGAPKAPAGP